MAAITGCVIGQCYSRVISERSGRPSWITPQDFCNLMLVSDVRYSSSDSCSKHVRLDGRSLHAVHVIGAMEATDRNVHTDFFSRLPHCSLSHRFVSLDDTSW